MLLFVLHGGHTTFVLIRPAHLYIYIFYVITVSKHKSILPEYSGMQTQLCNYYVIIKLLVKKH